MAIEIRPVTTPEEMQGCFRVRFVVFVDEQECPPEEELDGLDDAAMQFLVESDGDIVGTARVLDKGNGVGKIGRVALLKEYRGSGYGRDLMWYVMAAAFRRYSTLILDAQVYAIPFYEKLGFVAEGPVFLDAGIEHRRMTLER